ncbi:unnamed protein product [Adineta ricciae]|uniref:Amino acid transporter n=1 Tax=Adineta ricciae TaxID=249248 RepID=A0A813ZTW1_ADIRI|nr:unnamed protein product [Adineta ricciae]CAF1297055.1 unnamed protein product [Adineta ricciae]
MTIETIADNYDKEQQDADLRHLHEMGYLQELYRGFSPLMSFSYCLTAVNVLASISLGFTFTLTTGGSAVAIYSWIVASVFTILVGLSLAEICSVYPSAGSVYHWSGQLVSAQRAPLASFICGWLNFIGNIACDATFASGFANIVSSAFIISDRPPLSVNIRTAIGITILFLWCAQNSLRVDRNGWLNNIAAAFQILSSIVIVFVLYTASSQTVTIHDLFTSTYNGTGFPFVYVCLISILSTLFSFSGYEASANLSEETQCATRSAPRGIVITCICSSIFGAIYLMGLLIVIPNVERFMKDHDGETSSVNLAVATYQLAVPGRGALALVIILLINLYLGGMSSLTVTTRMGFSMARDGVFPYSSYLRWVHQGTKTPLATIMLVFVADTVLLLLQSASAELFTSLVAIGTIGIQTSYLLPILFRCTSARKTFPSGEFNLGRFGLPIATVSSVWLILTSILMFLPTKSPITVDNMNYSIVVFMTVLLIAGGYWLVAARHWFVGPQRVDHSIPLLPRGERSNENRLKDEILHDDVFE